MKQHINQKDAVITIIHRNRRNFTNKRNGNGGKKIIKFFVIIINDGIINQTSAFIL